MSFDFLDDLLFNSETFRNITRPFAYKIAVGDPEKVHGYALLCLRLMSKRIERRSKEIDYPNLHINVAGKEVMPFGPAEGLDKNGVALYPLSKIFGFVQWGTVVLDPRKGNPRPRLATDEIAKTIYNSQGFPSKGLEFAIKSARKYHEQGGEAPLLTSVCGIPLLDSQEGINIANGELEKLVGGLNDYSSGFIWNPFSPNTKALTRLRNPEVFRESGRIVSEIARNKLNLVKMGPYEYYNEDKTTEWLKLIESFLNGGGNGIVAVNTLSIDKRDKNHPSLEDWGYPVAGISGPYLRVYRNNAIRKARETFGKDIFIIGEGGIDSGMEAIEAFENGANALAGYTPYIFNGLGLVREIERYVNYYLHKEKCNTLEDFQNKIWEEIERNKGRPQKRFMTEEEYFKKDTLLNPELNPESFQIPNDKKGL